MFDEIIIKIPSAIVGALSFAGIMLIATLASLGLLALIYFFMWSED